MRLVADNVGVVESGRRGRRAESALAGLAELARSTGIPESNLVRCLAIERGFHERILAETDPARRRLLYSSLYNSVHPLLSAPSPDPGCQGLAALFASEFDGRSILDVGCGDGSLLRAIAAACSPRRLIGIDIYDFAGASRGGFEFVQQDIVSFRPPEPVDLVISSQVLEHIAPADLREHLRSVRQALKPGGLFIVLTPNRLWGPHDITRVVDFSNSNRIPAEGSHLSELTYRELIELLRASGFTAFKTVVPFADRIRLLRGLRVFPALNLLIERIAVLRGITYSVRRRGRAIYKNPVVLIAER